MTRGDQHALFRLNGANLPRFMTQLDGISRAPIRVLIPRLPPVPALLPYLNRIDTNRYYSNYGPLSREFGARLCALTGAGGVTLTCNGTSAIELALRALDRPSGGLCLMPSFTFIASAHAVCNAGLTPFLVEVDTDTMMLTPAIAEAAIRHMPTAPAAVLVVSAFGARPDFRGWANFEEEYGIPVVFDAAAAVTSLAGYVGRQPVCVSLHATKVLGVGEGGAILSADTALIERTTAMTGFGFVGSDRTATIRGGNYRPSEYTAAIGLAAMDSLPDRIEELKTMTAAYRARMANKAAMLQPGVGDGWVTMTLNVVLPAEEVVATVDRLTSAGIEWRRWWGLGCHTHPAFAALPRTDLSATDALAPCVIGVPFHDGVSGDDIDRIVACLP